MKGLSKKISYIFGLTARIAVSVIIITVIILKYEDFRTLDVRGLVEASSSVLTAVLTIWGIYLLKSMVFVIPASLIYIAVGMAFPAHWAILINAVGIFVEVAASYLFGRVMGGEYVVKKLKKAKHGDKILELYGKNKLSAIFAIRFLPVFPIDLVSLFLGTVKMKFLPYFLVSVGGILPRVILFTILGDGLYDYVPMDKIALVAAILLPAALIVWVVRYAIKAKKGKEAEGEKTEENTDEEQDG